MEEKSRIDLVNSLSKYSVHQGYRVEVQQQKNVSNSFSRQNKMIQKIARLMIKVNLSKNFDIKQFKLISSLSPQQWIRGQIQILQKLNEDRNAYNKYFSLFYKNHLKLSNWYLLAVKQKSQIGSYLFKQLLIQKKGEYYSHQNFNNEMLKKSFYNRNSSLQNTNQFIDNLQNFNKSSKFFRYDHYNQPANQNIHGHQEDKIQDASSQQVRGLNDSNHHNETQILSFMKPNLPFGLKKYQLKNKQTSLKKQKQQLMGVFFNNMIDLNTFQHKRKPLNLKLYKLKRKQDIDQHDLYMKTFDACNGRKYIFYDYQKHMKGLKQKNKYNQFVRTSYSDFSKQNCILNQQNDIKQNLKKYKQFQEQKKLIQQKQKCSLLPINMVLNQKDLNNCKGLKRIINENKSSKIVFVNHQGKPITYYIKEHQKDNEFKEFKRRKLKKLGVSRQKIGIDLSNSMTTR